MKTRYIKFLTAAFLVLAHPLLALAQQSQQPISPQPPSWEWPGPWHMWGGGWGFWWIFPLFMLLMVVFCIAIFFFLAHRLGGHHYCGPWHMMDRRPPGGDPTYSALQILNERFARGEIQRQEYEEKKAAILSGWQR